MARTLRSDESREQVALFQWAELAQVTWPDLRKLYAVPNGGFRSKATAGKLKAEGVRAGRPDIGLDVARHGYHGLRIELKRSGTREVPKGRLSEAQKSCLKDLTEDGYKAVVAYGWLAARDILVEYLS